MGNNSETEQTKRTESDNNANIRLKTLSNERAAEEQRMKNSEAQNSRVYESEKKKMEIQAQNEQLAAKKQLEKQKQEHENTMKAMQIAAETADQESKIKQKDEALEKIANITAEVTKTLVEDNADLIATKQTLAETQGSIKKNEIDIKEFPVNKTLQIDIYKDTEEILYNKKKADYDHDNEEIKAAVLSTGAHEDNVGQFLKLTHNLVGATVVTQANSNNLNTKLKTFNDLIEIITSDRLTIKNHFNDKKLARFVPIMDEAGMEDMDQLICENDEDYQEFLEMIKEGLEEQLEKWNETRGDSKTDDDSKETDKESEKPPSVKLTFAEKKAMKGMCLRSEKTWLKDQQAKQNIAKRSLKSVSPVLGKFFGGCYEGMNQVQEMLSLEENLNDSQKKAIKMSENVKDDDSQKKAIKMNENVKDDDDEKKDYNIEDVRDSWDIDSNVQIYSDSQNTWFDGQIVKVFTDKEGEWLNVKYETGNETITVDVQRGSNKVKALDNIVSKVVADSDLQIAMHEDDMSDQLVVECRVLANAAKLTVSVIATMEEDFAENQDSMRAKSVAIGVEDSCKQIIVGQAAIRQSVMLAQKIMTFKPANMENETTRKSWKALDNAIVHIFKSALEMLEISVEYFAFFLKFRSSFEYFSSCYAGDDDPSLAVSSEYIRRDVRNFCAFSKEFTRINERLRAEAMACIENCVREKAGYESFAMAKESRKKTVNAWLSAKKEVDAYAYEWDQKLENYRLLRISLSGNEKKLIYKQEMLQNRIKQNNEYLTNLDEQKAVLNKMNF